MSKVPKPISIKPIKTLGKVQPISPIAKVPIKPITPGKIKPISPVAKVPIISPKPIKPVKEEKNRRDLLEHLETFFGVRNMIQGNPQEGINFTEETLTYMTSRARADEITDIIVNKMQDLGKTPFILFDATSGIGGNTLSFLDNKNISYVISYEINQERQQFLINNIKMYGLAGTKSFVNNGFTGVPPEYRNSVLYMDPPWLPPNIPGNKSSKDQYMLSGIKIGDKTLEEWIERCKHCAMIVMRVPPGYRLEPVPGFRYESQLLGRKQNSLLIMVFPETAEPISPVVAKSKTKPLSPIQQEQLQSEAEWIEGLRRYLRDDLLLTFIPNEQARQKLTNDEVMPIWIRNFTHESWNPDIRYNYEQLEIYGDRVMDHNFFRYLIELVPTINEQELSEAKRKWLSKAYQSQLAQNLGMGRWLRTLFKRTTHTNEDVLEAFFGALEEAGDTAFKFGTGNGLAYEAIISMYGDIDLSQIKVQAEGHQKTQIKELFDKLGATDLLKKAQIWNQATRTLTIKLPRQVINKLREYGINIISPVIAEASGNTKKIATNNAFQQALERLTDIGVTAEWIDNLKEKALFERPEIAPYIGTVRGRLAEEGFKDIDFYTIEGTEGVEVAMFAIRPEGTKEVVAVTDAPVENNVEGIAQVVKAYAERVPLRRTY